MATVATAKPTTQDTGAIAMIERLLTPGGREELVAEREAEALAARQAEARAAIAAIGGERIAGAKAWRAQIAKVRAAFNALRTANAELVAITDADSAAYQEQDRIRFSAGLDDKLDARLLANLGDLTYLAGALVELEQQGRAAINSWETR